MDLHNLTSPVLYYGNVAYFLEPVSIPVRAYQYSYLGGPLEGTYGKVEGKIPQPFPLQRLLTIDTDIISAIEKKSGSIGTAIPILFGFRYSGCMLKYDLTERSNVRITEFSGDSEADDWPYSNFPQILPFYPLRVSRQDTYDRDEFAELFTWQGLSDEQYDLVMIIPNSALPGVSLWGPEHPEVLIVAECNITEKKIMVTSQVD